ncbi:MAG: tripartite tricarboxylate transporter substrate binding protein [Betaproteobacteria bacterium]|nr:tripartite tricarboxylate transporter substrate binding protein [Betaproteobacteria bacterium]
MKRQWLRLQPVVWTLALTTSVAAAQSGFPNKPVRIVHGFTPGGISDLLARSLGAQLATSLGQQILVEPRPGAGTTIASDHIAKSPGDGYTLFLQDITTHAINASLYRRLPYDSVRDFTPITLIAATPLMLLVHPSLPAKSVKELIALAKKHPNEIAHGSSGNGTIVHLAAEMLKAMAGIRMIHVPYKGSPQAVVGLLSGEVAVSFSTMPPALPNVAAGKLRALGVTTPSRTSAAPNVPTMKEAGLKDFELVLYSGILAPRDVPRPVVDRLNAEFAKAVRLPEVQKIYVSVGAAPITNTPEEFAAHIRAELVKLGKLVELSGARVD